MCENDAQCLDLEFCYLDNAFEDDGAFCDCSFLHGWEGQNCTDLGPGAIFTLVAASIEIFIAFLMFVWMLRLYKYVKSEVTLFSYNNRILFLLTLGFMSFFFWRGISIRLVTTPGEANLIGTEGNTRGLDIEVKYHRLFPIEIAAIGTLTIPIMFIVATIGEMWLETGQKVKHSNMLMSRRKQKVKIIKIVFNVASFIWVIAFVGLVVEERVIALFSSLGFLTIHGIILIIAWLNIRGVLNHTIVNYAELRNTRAVKESYDSQKIQTETDKLESYVRIIRLTAAGLLFPYVLFIASAAIFASLTYNRDGWRTFSRAGQISPNTASLEMISISSLMFFAITLYFCYQSYKQLEAVRLRAKSDVLRRGKEDDSDSGGSDTEIVDPDTSMKTTSNKFTSHATTQESTLLEILVDSPPKVNSSKIKKTNPKLLVEETEIPGKHDLLEASEVETEDL